MIANKQTLNAPALNISHNGLIIYYVYTGYAPTLPLIFKKEKLLSSIQMTSLPSLSSSFKLAREISLGELAAVPV